MNTVAVKNGLEVTFMGQAGFIFRFNENTSIGVDLYLSDCCYRYFGFKRLMPYICDAHTLNLDFVVCTHAHYDHFDPDSVPILLSNPNTKLIAAHDVRPEAQRLGLEETKITYVREGDLVCDGNFTIEAIPCDHGADTPDAIGILLTVGDKKIVIAGDTCFHEEYFTSKKVKGADLLILPINGAYGNLNETEAAKAAVLAEAALTIPCHFWNFAEHGGNPEKFVQAIRELAPNVSYMLMRPGETFTL